MPEQDDTPKNAEVDESQDDDKLLDDLDPEEEEAAGVEGGARARWGRL